MFKKNNIRTLVDKSVRFFPWWNRFDSSHIIGLINMMNHILEYNKISNIVEIGSHLGESSSIFLGFPQIKTIYCIDTWDNYQYENIFNERLRNHLDNRCIKLKSTSELASKSFENNSLDMVYIDGDHNYECVKKDIDIWYQKVKSGGILSGHDYHESWPGCKLAIDEFIANNHYIVTTFIDCSWYIIKR
jgi:hypothetical protein